MWIATYKTIDKSGLRPELKVTVIFSNDQDSTTYEQEYNVLPNDLNETFIGVIQVQIDILNVKDEVKQTDIDVLIDRPIEIKPLDIKPII